MKVLIVDYMHESIGELMSGIGVEADYSPEITRAEILEVVHKYDGLVIRSKTKVDKQLIDSATTLKFIGRAGAGIDNLDVDYLEEKGITILNAPEGNRNALGEHCLGLLLSLLNHIPKSDKEVRNAVWDREGNRGFELAGKTVGLIGIGHMGMSFAKKLKGMGVRILAYDKYKSDFADDKIEESSLDNIFSEADILSIHVPLTDETRYMVDAEFIDSFDKPIFILNTSRGEVLSLAALCEALKSGKVLGAGLDVLENEKLATLSTSQRVSFDYLANSDKTILTPHVGGWSFESYERINQVLIEKIRKEILLT